MKNLLSLILVLLTSLGFFGCHDLFDGDDECHSCNEGMGTLKGNILTVDSTGDALTDLSGAIVTIIGNTYSNFDTTDANGNWQFYHVPAGIYQFSIDKPGYGGIKWYDFQFVGNGTLDLKRTYLGRAPHFALQLSDLVVNSYQLSAKISPIDPPTFIQRSIVAISHHVAPSPLDSSNYAISQESAFAAPSSLVTATISTDLLHERGFLSGDTCYIASFGIGQIYHLSNTSGVIPSFYSNPVTENLTFTATGPSSNVIQFVMP